MSRGMRRRRTPSRNTERMSRDEPLAVLSIARCLAAFGSVTEAKRRFFAEMDFFVFRVGQDTAGVFVAHPTDWSSYYLRSTAILPHYRERRLMTRFFERLAEPLRAAGVERIEAECSPANAPIIRVLSRQGYIVTGSASSERWGSLLRYTKFLSHEAHSAFIRQYTAMTFTTRPNGNHNRQE